MGFGPFLMGLGAGAKDLRQSRMQRDAIASKKEEVARQRMLEDVLNERQAEQHAAQMRSRSLEDALNTAKLDEFKKKPAVTVTPSQRDYDQQRGVIVDKLSGEVIKPTGLPTVQKPVSEVQQASLEAKRLQTARDLRSDYMKDPAVQNASNLSGVVRGLKAGLAGQTPMDDLSIIYETVKMFDPESVVREGEIKLFRTAASLPLQLRLMVDRWNNGRLLTPGMRAHISALLDRKVSEARTGMEGVQSQFGKTARDYGVSADSAFIAPDQLRGITASKRSRLPNQD